MPTDVFVPPKFVVTAPALPEGLSSRERAAQNIKNDQLVDKANKCQHRIWWNMRRLNIPSEHKNGIKVLKSQVFFILIELLEEVNMEWAKQNTMVDWLVANKVAFIDQE